MGVVAVKTTWHLAREAVGDLWAPCGRLPVVAADPGDNSELRRGRNSGRVATTGEITVDGENPPVLWIVWTVDSAWGAWMVMLQQGGAPAPLLQEALRRWSGIEMLHTAPARHRWASNQIPLQEGQGWGRCEPRYGTLSTRRFCASLQKPS